MLKIKDIKSCDTIEALENLGFGKVEYEINHRGGGLGFLASDVVVALDGKISESDIPRKYGCGCNYLGGGVRGAVTVSGYNKSVGASVAKILDALAEACKRAYINAEDEIGFNDDYEDGETNWDAEATRASRVAGVVSAY